MTIRGVNPGKYRERIAIQEPVEEQNSESGDVIVTWANVWLDSSTELSAVPAEVLTGPGREAKISGTTEAETSLRISFRFFVGFMPSWRIVWKGKAYDVKSVELDASNRREYRVACVGLGVPVVSA